MTYIRNTALDLTYDYHDGSYILPYTVANMQGSAFYKHSTVTEIDVNNIPIVNNSLVMAFTNCRNLQHISNIPNSVTNLYGAFVNCRSLEEAPALPTAVVNIDWAFRDCINLTNRVTIPNSVTSMYGTFYNCQNLLEVSDIPDSVQNMYGTFYGCTKLQSVPNLPNYITQLPLTFMLSGIDDMPIIPNSVTSLVRTFIACRNIVAITNRLPNSIISLYQTFSECYNLVTPPVIPDSVTGMYSTFAACYNLQSAPIIPNSVTNMAGCFYACEKLTSISTLPKNLVNMGKVSADLKGAGCFGGCKNLTTAPAIPNTVVDMNSSFCDTGIITMPTIPNSVMNMSDCFMNCNALKTIKSIPNSVIYIDGCFTNCTNLTTAPVIPASVQVINSFTTDLDKQGLFSGCTNLTGDIFILSNQITNAKWCFDGTSLPKNVYVPANSDTYNAFINAGYDTEGTLNGVYLKELKDTILTVIPSASTPNATVQLIYGDIIKTGTGRQFIDVNLNDTVDYIVTQVGLPVVEGSVVMDESKELTITLDTIPSGISYEVSYDDSIYTIGTYTGFTNPSLLVADSTQQNVNLADGISISTN